MFVSYLSLMDFRSYKSLELKLNTGTHIFLGENGEGKTNIAESIMYLALLSSHRVSSTTPLIKLGAEKAYIRAKIEDGSQSSIIELEINNGRANRAKLNQNPVRSQREIAGIVKAICFSPEDLEIVKGDPSTRRNFLDQLLIQFSPRLAGVLSDYDRVLRQRNTLLKTSRNLPKESAGLSTLDAWDEQLVELGSEIILQRIMLVRY